MTASRDPYVVLGLLPRATSEEVQHAFRRLVRQHHPDTAAGAGDPDELSAVLAAYAAVRAGRAGRDMSGGRRNADTVARAGSARHGAVQAWWGETTQRPGPPPPTEPPIRVGPLRWHRRTR